VSQNTTAQTWLAWIQGEVVSYADMLALQAALQGLVGSGIATQQGVLNALPLLQPLQVATNGTMAISLGGNNQRVLCDGFLCDGCPAQAFTVPTAPGSGTRVDLIAIQNALVTVGSVNRQVETAPGEFSTEAINTQNYGVAYQYIEGTVGGGAPSAPSGWDAFATVTVAAGTSAITSGDIAYLFPDMNPAGPTGPTGVTGATGPAVPPFTLTTAANTVPAVNAAVTLAVANGAAFPSQMPVFVVSADTTQKFYGTITGGALSDSLTITCTSIEAGTAGASLPIGAMLMVSGPPGPQGSTGTTGATGGTGNTGATGTRGATGAQGPSPIAHATAGVVMPAVGSTVSVPVDLPAGYPFATYVILTDGTTAFYGQITGAGSPLTIQNLGVIAGSAGATIASGATLTFSGPPSFQIAIGQMIDSGGSNSLTLPNYGVWRIRYKITIEPGSNTFFSTSLSVGSGTVSITTITNAGNDQNNIPGGFVAALSGTADGGQTITIATGASGSFGASPTVEFTALRTA